MHKKKYKNRHTINYRKTANVVINKKIKKKKNNIYACTFVLANKL